nr:CHAP domain-containing protein [Streptococcus parauberis]
MLMLAALAVPSIQTLSVLAEDTTPSTSQSSSSTTSMTSTEGATDSTATSSSSETATSTDQTTAPSSSTETVPSSSSTEPSSSSSSSTTPTSTSTSSSPTTDASQTQPGTAEGNKTPAPEPTQPAPATPQEATPSPAQLPTVDSWSDFSVPAHLPSAMASAAYVEHWTGQDAYSHNLLSHRYGITAAQLDGYLKSTGIAYDTNRINGAKLLEWEKESGLDVRAIIAIAMAESSLGTQGVAKEAGANMFGYGAFDNNPGHAKAFNDQVAVTKMTEETIIQNHNTSFEIQDNKAKLLSAGRLNISVEGGVYFTDTSGTGKSRAKIMEAIDQWIDQHGGTPAIPKELQMQSSALLTAVPVSFKLSKPNHVIGYSAVTYPWGQCTWYVYNRAQELGYHFGQFMGNGGDWKNKAGYETTHTPKVGYALSFSPGQAGADPSYGHVAIVEEVKKDGTVLISESNCIGLGVISYRTFSAAQASQLTYVVGER